MLGIVLGKIDHDLAPQLGAFQYIGLVDGTHPTVALGGDLEGDAANAPNLRLGVDQGVVSLTLAAVELTHTARLTEVHAAGQFAHDHDIQAGDDFRLERRGIGQLRVQNRRPQIGEQAHAGAQTEQTLFRTHGDR